MSKSLKKLFPKNLRKLVAAVPLAGAAAEAAGLIATGRTVQILRSVASGLTVAGAVAGAAIAISERLADGDLPVIDVGKLLGS